MKKFQLWTFVMALCVLMSSMVSADTRTFDLTGFDGVSAAEGLHVFVVTATSDKASQPLSASEAFASRVEKVRFHSFLDQSDVKN